MKTLITLLLVSASALSQEGDRFILIDEFKVPWSTRGLELTGKVWKDTVTGDCFLATWAGMINGGPALVNYTCPTEKKDDAI